MAESWSITELRQALRSEASKSSIRVVAKRIGIAHTTLGDFIDANEPRVPYGRTLEKVVGYVARLAGGVDRSEGESAVSYRTDGPSTKLLVREASALTDDPVGFAAGVLWSIERQSLHIAQTAAAARAQLQESPANRPRVSAIEETAAVAKSGRGTPARRKRA